MSDLDERRIDLDEKRIYSAVMIGNGGQHDINRWNVNL
jgi:hypothetical protein